VSLVIRDEMNATIFVVQHCYCALVIVVVVVVNQQQQQRHQL
jgi:hypothetical protein